MRYGDNMGDDTGHPIEQEVAQGERTNTIKVGSEPKFRVLRQSSSEISHPSNMAPSEIRVHRGPNSPTSKLLSSAPTSKLPSKTDSPVFLVQVWDPSLAGRSACVEKFGPTFGFFHYFCRRAKASGGPTLWLWVQSP